MTEETPEVVDNEQDSNTQTSPGTQLRLAREAQGMTQLDMANKLYLRVSNIDDIEHDKINDNSSVTFAKGYVKLYAKHLGLDVAAVVESFEQYHTAKPEPAKLQSFSRRVAKQANDDRWMMVTYVILIVVIASAVVWWFQQTDSTSDLFESVTNESEDVAAVVTAEDSQDSVDTSVQTFDSTQAPADENVDSESSLASDGATDEPLSTPVQEDVLADQYAATVADDADERSEFVAETTPQVAVAEPVNLGASVELVFTFSEDCWVNITDASGERIAYGIKAAGRVMPVTGYAPFEVTLGAPQVVKLTFDGEPVDLSRFREGRTARFNLPLQES